MIVLLGRLGLLARGEGVDCGQQTVEGKQLAALEGAGTVVLLSKRQWGNT